MTQNISNKIPTLGTLLATALGIAYGAWAVIARLLVNSPKTEARVQSSSNQSK